MNRIAIGFIILIVVFIGVTYLWSQNTAPTTPVQTNEAPDGTSVTEGEGIPVDGPISLTVNQQQRIDEINASLAAKLGIESSSVQIQQLDAINAEYEAAVAVATTEAERQLAVQTLEEKTQALFSPGSETLTDKQIQQLDAINAEYEAAVAVATTEAERQQAITEFEAKTQAALVSEFTPEELKIIAEHEAQLEEVLNE